MVYSNPLGSWLALAILGASLPLAAQQTSAAPQPPSPPATQRMLARGGFLGVGIQEITADRAKALKLHDNAGVEVTRVRPDSPAEMAGLKSGDVILQYGGTKVEGLEQMSRMVRETPVGKDVKVDFIRNGSAMAVTVRIGQYPGAQMFSKDSFVPNMPDMPRVFQGWRSPMLGVEVEAIEGQLAQFFGVKQGVLVRSVIQQSPAEKAALKAGDVILRVDDTAVANPAEVAAKLRTLPGKTFNLTLMREHKEMQLQVTLGKEVPDVSRH
ncbi:MAG: PDZ domain-containing protein [Bryobacteraceae bacterium]